MPNLSECNVHNPSTLHSLINGGVNSRVREEIFQKSNKQVGPNKRGGINWEIYTKDKI